MANVRVNQSVIEAVTLQIPNVRVCQSVIEFASLSLAPTIACGNPPVGTQGLPYSHDFPVTGGTLPFTFSIIAGALPPGLTLDSSSGDVSGVPEAGGNFTFTILVTDAVLRTSSISCSILIAPILKITLRGVKRYKCEPGEDGPQVTEVPTLPSVKRAV